LEIRDDSKIDFSNISWRKEDQFYIVWVEGTSNFIELDENSFRAYKLLNDGNTPEKVSEALKNLYKKTYDVKNFIYELLEIGFISAIDSIPISSVSKTKKNFAFLKKQYVSWIYSKPFLLLYLTFILLAFFVLLFNPKYLPSYSDFFLFENYIFNLAIFFSVGLVLIFFHELAHLIAGKVVGVDSYFSIGLRLYIPVAETNLTQLWSVPRKKRYLPFLAGMLNDTLLLSLMVFILWFIDLNPNSFLLQISAFARLTILLLYYSLIWQFLLFIRTDIYFAISNFFRCRNLYSDSWNFILNFFLKVFKRKQLEQNIPQKELKVIKIYAPIMFFSTILALLLFAIFALPIFSFVFIEGINRMLAGIQGNIMFFVEGLLLTCLIGIQLFSFILFTIRSLFRFTSILRFIGKESLGKDLVIDEKHVYISEL
jgi:putative peptide zinc metalloprotease protein